MDKHSLFVSLHHGSLIVADLDCSLNFYCYILGLEQDKQRPKMGFDGAWLNIGEQQIHLLRLPATEQAIDLPNHVGRDRHLAIYVTQIDILVARLKAHKIAFTMSSSGRQAIFCRDPDNNGLEFIQIPNLKGKL